MLFTSYLYIALFLLISPIVAPLPDRPVRDVVFALLDALPGQVQTDDIPPPYNTRFDESNGYLPKAMVYVKSVEDIITALQICHDGPAPVALRSNGGHSYIGQSTVHGGIIINFSELKDFDVTMEDGRYIAKLGAGLKELEVYSRLARHDPPLGFAGGSGSTVGIAGLISGGGHGLSSALFGLTSDRVVAAEVVVYNLVEDKFELVNATPYNEHSELLFAIRGGMGGNYGALVSLSYDAPPVTNVVTLSNKNFEVNPFLQAQRIKDFQNFMHSAESGPEIFGIGKFLGGGGIQYSAQCICDSNGDCTSCHSKLDKMEAAVGLATTALRVEQDYGKAMWYWADCTVDSWNDFYPPEGIANCSEEEMQEAMEKCWEFDRAFYGGPYKAKSIYFPADMRMEDLESLAQAHVDPLCRSPGDCVTLLDFYGHAMSVEPEECNGTHGKCTSFDHRTPGWHMQMLSIWEEDEPTPIGKLEWLQESYEAVLPGSLGTAYQNYIDSDLAEGRQWVNQYFPNGDTYPRLQQAKCKYNGIDMYNFYAIDLMTVDIDDEICGFDTDTTTPVIDTTTPVIDTTTPVIDTTTPVIDTTTPVIDTTTPVIDTTTPVIDTTTPVIDTTTPVIDTTTPVIDTTTPVIDTTTPVIDTTTPVIDTTTPVIDTTTPVIDTTTPVIDTTTSGGSCDEADRKCADGYPGSYCMSYKYPSVCWGSNIPCSCSSVTTSSSSTTHSIAATTCDREDLRCAGIKVGSYCKYWSSPPHCWGTTEPCDCS